MTRHGDVEPPGEPGWREVLEAGKSQVPAVRIELRRVAAATRLIIDQLVANDDDEATLAAAADALESISRSLSGGGRSSYDVFAAAMASGADPGAFFDHSPLLGLANPIAPPMEIEYVDGRAVGHATFGSAYEGPPGCVHGGWIAAAFDELLGSAQAITNNPGMTGTLRVIYRSPTPLHQPLRFEAGVDRVEGRKIFTTGTLHAGARLTAEADAVFISLDRERFLAMRAGDGTGASPRRAAGATEPPPLFQPRPPSR